MPRVTRDALKEWDDEVRMDAMEISDLLEESPPEFQFRGSDLNPVVVVPSEPFAPYPYDSWEGPERDWWDEY